MKAFDCIRTLSVSDKASAISWSFLPSLIMTAPGSCAEGAKRNEKSTKILFVFFWCWIIFLTLREQLLRNQEV